MRVRLTLGLVDRPGTLLKVLEQVATHGGNIISIIHSRDRITGGYVPVSMNIEFPDLESFERARSGIESLGIPVMESETLESRIETLIIIGPVSVEAVTREMSTQGVKIVGLSLSGNPSNPCLKIVLELPTERRQSVMSALEELTSSSGSLLIREAEL